MSAHSMESLWDITKSSAGHLGIRIAPVGVVMVVLLAVLWRRYLTIWVCDFARHGRFIVQHAVAALQSPVLAARLTRAKYLLWAASVGMSVTLRLWSSVRIASACSLDPFLASVHISAASSALSAACLIPFASWQSMPQGLGPWLSGLCTMPAASLIAASQVLGLGLVQMIVKLSTLATALLLDVLAGGQNQEGLRQRLVGIALVLGGVALSVCGAAAAWPAMPSLGTSMLLLYSLGCFASGSGYVLQARLSVAPRVPCTGDRQSSPEVAAASAAIACQVGSGAVQLLIMAMFRLSGTAVDGGFCMRPRHAHLWLLAGLQGAFYVQSMQALPARVGYAATFSLTLCGQLVSAVAVDALQTGMPPSVVHLAGLLVVVGGACMSGMAGSPGIRDDKDCEALAISQRDFSGNFMKIGRTEL